jgi:4-aminobutyrate---pyruvate transaminase
VELMANRETRTCFDPGRKVGARLSKLGEENGLILRSLPGDSMAFSPPLIITEEEVDEMFDRFGRALDELTVQLRRESIAAV